MINELIEKNNVEKAELIEIEEISICEVEERFALGQNGCCITICF